MTKEERKEALSAIANHLFIAMDGLREHRDRLAEIRCKKESEQLDKIIGDLLNLSDNLFDKVRS